MARIKKILAIPLLFVCFLGSTAALSQGEYNVVNSVYAEPLKPSGQSTKFYVTCNSTFGTGYKGRISIRLTNEKYTRLLVAYYQSDSGYTSCVLEYTNKYNASSNNVFTLEYTKDSKTMTKVNLNVEYAYSGLITTNECYSGYYRAPANDCSTDGMTTTKHYDELFFKSFDPIFYPEFYSKIDLTKIQFQEKVFGGYRKPTFGSATLSFDADLYCFGKLGIASGLRRYIDLDIVDAGNNQYSFAFKNNVYVNPSTYEMSEIKYDGFVQTKYLYLPRNEMNQIGTLSFLISVSDLGIAKSYLNYNFSVQPIRNTVGDCINSEYCIHTNVTPYQGLVGEIIK